MKLYLLSIYILYIEKQQATENKEYAIQSFKMYQGGLLSGFSLVVFHLCLCCCLQSDVANFGFSGQSEMTGSVMMTKRCEVASREWLVEPWILACSTAATSLLVSEDVPPWKITCPRHIWALYTNGVRWIVVLSAFILPPNRNISICHLTKGIAMRVPQIWPKNHILSCELCVRIVL